MNKVGKAVLVGALTFGGFVGTNLAVEPAKASANWDANWGITDTQALFYINDWSGDGLGMWYLQTNQLSFRAEANVAKIFRVFPGGSMSVYKTLYPDVNGNFETQLNSNYHPGQYVVVVKDYFGKYSDSHIFNIE